MTSNMLSASAPSVVSIAPAASLRAFRQMLRAPGPLISSLLQSVFFMLIYAGQLENIGSGFLSDRPFIAFLLPLILMTGAATTAASAGQMVLSDIQSGYMDRLRMASGLNLPFLFGPWFATTIAVAAQTGLTMGIAALFGYRPHDPGAMLAIVLLMTAFGSAVAIISIAAALLMRTPAATGAVTLVFFGLSFFTGFFAPVEQLSGWMRAVAQFNPLTYTVELARDIEAGANLAHIGLATGFIAALALIGIAGCAVATRQERSRR